MNHNDLAKTLLEADEDSFSAEEYIKGRAEEASTPIYEGPIVLINIPHNVHAVNDYMYRNAQWTPEKFEDLSKKPLYVVFDHREPRKGQEHLDLGDRAAVVSFEHDMVYTAAGQNYGLRDLKSAFAEDAYMDAVNGFVQYFQTQIAAKKNVKQAVTNLVLLGRTDLAANYARHISRANMSLGRAIETTLALKKAGKRQRNRIARFMKSQENVKWGEHGFWLLFDDWADLAPFYGESRNQDYAKNAKKIFGGDAYEWFDDGEPSVEDTWGHLSDGNLNLIRQLLIGRMVYDSDGEEYTVEPDWPAELTDDELKEVVCDRGNKNGACDDIYTAILRASSDAYRSEMESAYFNGYQQSLLSEWGLQMDRDVKWFVIDGKNKLGLYFTYKTLEEWIAQWKEDEYEDDYYGDIHDLAAAYLPKVTPDDDYSASTDEEYLNQQASEHLSEIEPVQPPRQVDPQQPEFPLDDPSGKPRQIDRPHMVRVGSTEYKGVAEPEAHKYRAAMADQRKDVFTWAESFLASPLSRIDESAPTTPGNFGQSVVASLLEREEGRSEFHMPENFDKVKEGSGWDMWAGANDWEIGHSAACVMFSAGDGLSKRIWMEIKHPGGNDDSKVKHDEQEACKKRGKEAVDTWIRIARKIVNTKDENGLDTNWQKAFTKALSHEELAPFVDKSGEDKSQWARDVVEGANGFVIASRSDRGMVFISKNGWVRDEQRATVFPSRSVANAHFKKLGLDTHPGSDIIPFRGGLREAIERLDEDVYNNSTTQIDLPEDIGQHIIAWGKLNIPDDALYIDEDGGCGRETEQHVTVLYGLKEPAPSDALKDIVGNTKPFLVELSGVTLFENEKYDVVKLDVISEELTNLSNAIRAACPNNNKFPDYHGHVTIAYVKPGRGKEFAGADVFKAAQVSRDFWAYEMKFKGAGDSEDPNRVVDVLYFDKEGDPGHEAPKPGPARYPKAQRVDLDTLIDQVGDMQREMHESDEAVDPKDFVAAGNCVIKCGKDQYLKAAPDGPFSAEWTFSPREALVMAHADGLSILDRIRSEHPDHPLAKTARMETVRESEDVDPKDYVGEVTDDAVKRISDEVVATPGLNSAGRELLGFQLLSNDQNRPPEQYDANEIFDHESLYEFLAVFPEYALRYKLVPRYEGDIRNPRVLGFHTTHDEVDESHEDVDPKEFVDGDFVPHVLRVVANGSPIYWNASLNHWTAHKPDATRYAYNDAVAASKQWLSQDIPEVVVDDSHIPDETDPKELAAQVSRPAERGCPECGSHNLTEPDDEGLIDCLDCGIWFNPRHPSNLGENENVDPKEFLAAQSYIVRVGTGARTCYVMATPVGRKLVENPDEATRFTQEDASELVQWLRDGKNGNQPFSAYSTARMELAEDEDIDPKEMLNDTPYLCVIRKNRPRGRPEDREDRDFFWNAEAAAWTKHVYGASVFPNRAAASKALAIMLQHFPNANVTFGGATIEPIAMYESEDAKAFVNDNFGYVVSILDDGSTLYWKTDEPPSDTGDLVWSGFWVPDIRHATKMSAEDAAELAEYLRLDGGNGTYSVVHASPESEDAADPKQFVQQNIPSQHESKWEGRDLVCTCGQWRYNNVGDWSSSIPNAMKAFKRHAREYRRRERKMQEAQGPMEDDGLPGEVTSFLRKVRSKRRKPSARPVL